MPLIMTLLLAGEEVVGAEAGMVGGSFELDDWSHFRCLRHPPRDAGRRWPQPALDLTEATASFCLGGGIQSVIRESQIELPDLLSVRKSDFFRDNY